jgi:hypothetical protein
VTGGEDGEDDAATVEETAFEFPGIVVRMDGVAGAEI